MIINQGNLNNLFTGYKASFNTGVQGVTPHWQRIATLIPSSTREEIYAWLGEFPGLREWIGDRFIKNMASHNYSIRNKDFESTVSVKKNDIEDETYGIYAKLFEAMGQAAAVHPDELVFSLLKAGFTTTCFDGQYFFDTDHPVGGASVSNMQNGNENPWFLIDTRKPLKPLIFQKRQDYNLQALNKPDDERVFMRKEYLYGVDARCNVGFGFWQQAFGSKKKLNANNFNKAYAAMLSLKSDEGRPLAINPDLLLVGPSNRENAFEVIKAERLANGATNTNRGVVEVLIVPWLE